jgi:hypothetical protein
MSNIIQFPKKADTWSKLVPLINQLVIEQGYSSEFAIEYTNNFKSTFDEFKFEKFNFNLELPVITEREKVSAQKTQDALNGLRKDFDRHIGNIILSVILKDLSK